MQLAWKVDPGSNVKLQDYDPDYIDEHVDPALARAELEQLGKELGELQELLAAAHHQSLLIVLQGMDTSGKADTIHQVLSRVNPQGCEVRSFKVPSSRELDMTSSGACTASRQARVSSVFSIGPTTRMCWSCAYTTYNHKRSGIAATPPLTTLSACCLRIT